MVDALLKLKPKTTVISSARIDALLSTAALDIEVAALHLVGVDHVGNEAERRDKDQKEKKYEAESYPLLCVCCGL
jgi:hypothetical protein